MGYLTFEQNHGSLVSSPLAVRVHGFHRELRAIARGWNPGNVCETHWISQPALTSFGCQMCDP